METRLFNCCSLLLPLFIFLLSTLPLTISIGINYGQVADNLLDPKDVLPLLRSINVTKVKLYDTNPKILKAFAHTGIDFTVGLPDKYITDLANSTAASVHWLKSNIIPYLPGTNITSITVGNEVLTGKDVADIDSLLPAMESLHAALVKLKLDGRISVTTPHSLDILDSSYPPASSTFKPDVKPYMAKILPFMSKTRSPFLINAYPYFAYKSDPTGVKIGYVLFESTDSGVVDPMTKLKYENMLFAQVDAVRAAIVSVLGKKKGEEMEVRVSETGWPSKGDEDEEGATKENARKYNGNLMKLVDKEKKGTPMTPHVALEVYIFAVFNENLKPGPTSERNYGLFKPDGTPAYDFGLKVLEKNSTHILNGTGLTGVHDLSSPTPTPTPAPSLDRNRMSSAHKVFNRFGSLTELVVVLVLWSSW